MTITPSLVRRLPARCIRRMATSFGNDGERRASKRNCTADDTLLTFCPPGPEARTKDSDSSDSSMEMLSVTGIMTPSCAIPGRGRSPRTRNDETLRLQILLRQHLALFHRRLVEGVDAQKLSGDDRLQHEMHQQFAERLFVELRNMDRAHRAAILGQSLGGGAPLRADEVTDRLAAESWLPAKLRQFLVHARADAGAVHRDHREQLVARAADEELQLAVLVDRPERRDRRGALALLAKALGPELHV